MAVRYRYSRWDGTQVGFELDADDVLAEITDDLLYHGDLNAALRRMLQSGFLDRNQERVAGLREVLEKLRRRRRDELMDRLRQQLLQSYFHEMSGALQGMTPEQLQRMKDMFNGLNQLLEMREAGQDTDAAFQQFMEQFGDFFPGNPQTLDELLEQMAQQMAAMQSLLNSMTPEQRSQLEGLSRELLEDMDLRWQVDRLAANLRGAFPQAG